MKSLSYLIVIKLTLQSFLRNDQCNIANTASTKLKQLNTQGQTLKELLEENLETTVEEPDVADDPAAICPGRLPQGPPPLTGDHRHPGRDWQHSCSLVV